MSNSYILHKQQSEILGMRAKSHVEFQLDVARALLGTSGQPVQWRRCRAQSDGAARAPSVHRAELTGVDQAGLQTQAATPKVVFVAARVRGQANAQRPDLLATPARRRLNRGVASGASTVSRVHRSRHYSLKLQRRRLCRFCGIRTSFVCPGCNRTHMCYGGCFLALQPERMFT